MAKTIIILINQTIINWFQVNVHQNVVYINYSQELEYVFYKQLVYVIKFSTSTDDMHQLKGREGENVCIAPEMQWNS